LPQRKKNRTHRASSVLRWIPPDSPITLSNAIRDRISREYDATGVFLNIPFDDRYSALEMAITSTLTAYGLTPHIAKERRRVEVRLFKIVELMLTCRYGITDLSMPNRMNMPFELGLLLGFGRETFLMSSKRYSALQSISDMNFCDVYYHENKSESLISGLSQWIERTCSKKQISTRTLIRRFEVLKAAKKSLGEDYYKLRIDQIKSLLGIAQEGLRYAVAPQHKKQG
jgi:hypothetical protein